MKHTKEPWYIGYVHQSNGPAILAKYVTENQTGIQWIGTTIGEKTCDANAARIVACVNACAGMDDPATEIANLREEVEYWKLRHQLMKRPSKP